MANSSWNETASPPPDPGRNGALVCFVGRSGSGKTTLIETLISSLKGRGYQVASINHHGHPGLEVDRAGKDSWRHSQAGAEAVALVAPDRLFLQRRIKGPQDPRDVLALLGPVDIVISEGAYAWRRILKIEILDEGEESLCRPEELVALVADAPQASAVLTYRRNDVERLADFIVRRFLRH